VLSVNSDVPILNIAIQAPFAIEISQDADITVLPPTGDNKYFMKAVYQGNDCLRAELKLHPVEGQTGILVASILIRTNPVLCLSRQYQVKPLASYQRSVVNAKSDNSKM
jgi:hypothetical protein